MMGMISCMLGVANLLMRTWEGATWLHSIREYSVTH